MITWRTLELSLQTRSAPKVNNRVRGDNKRQAYRENYQNGPVAVSRAGFHRVFDGTYAVTLSVFMLLTLSVRA
jgi:hypothetical protein